MDNDLLKIKIDEARTKLPIETKQAIDNVDWKITVLQMRESKGYSYSQLEDLEIETELLLCGLLSPEEYPIELEKRMGLPGPEINELVSEMNQKVFQKIKQELVKINEIKKTKQRKEENSIREPTIIKLEKTETVSTPEIHPADREILSSTGIEIMSADSAKSTVLADRPEEIKGRPVEIKKIIEQPAPKVISENPEILPKVEKTSPAPMGTMSSAKLSGSFQSKEVKTEHSLENLSKTSPANIATANIPVKPKVDPYREIPI